MISGKTKREYFCAKDWTGQISLISLGKFQSARSRFLRVADGTRQVAGPERNMRRLYRLIGLHPPGCNQGGGLYHSIHADRAHHRRRRSGAAQAPASRTRREFQGTRQRGMRRGLRDLSAVPQRRKVLRTRAFDIGKPLINIDNVAEALARLEDEGFR